MTAAGVRPPQRFAWLQALRQPQCALEWSLPEWERVVRLARRLRLLSRLAEGLTNAGLIDAVPVQARRHLIAEMRLSRWRIQAVVWTLERMEAALGNAGYPRVLLKGAAYIGQDLPIAAGRLPSDLDILVPVGELQDALSRLERAGWSAVELDEHDRRYYREWSHEVPPMRHALHAVELDLHHNILPPLARTHVDAGRLFERVQASKWRSWQVLCPVDQVLHSAAHLFHDSEARDRLRDLVDLDGLLRHFSRDPAFWLELPQRAHALGLTESLALACHFCVRWLGTPVPQSCLQAAAALGPAARRRALLLRLWAQVLTPTEPEDKPSSIQSLSATVLLARYHWHRLPIRVLVPHLWHKVRPWRSARPAPAAAGTLR